MVIFSAFERLTLRRLAVGLLACASWAWAPTLNAAVDFQKDIHPILSEHCTQCHGPDESNRKAELRLDIRDEALKERKGARAIAPGKPEISSLLERIEHSDPEEIMPPPKVKKPLSAKQKALLRQWIQEGAPYTQHWAFERPQWPAVPEKNGASHPIDALVRHRLAKEGLKPSPEADRTTLLRRLSLDLLGLPPAPEQVRAFLSDPRADAYERLVDTLLASPHFGERWARHWLDLARYADSDGYEKDIARPTAYLYRDWVIEAINADMPFDQFTIRQLAGDLLPQPSAADMIATGFHRQTLTNREGGVDKEEFRCKAVVDRTHTTGAVWLGLTVGCAECHSHKFDPISHKEFYQMYAFFNDANERDFSYQSPEQLRAHQSALAGWQKRVSALEKSRETLRTRVSAEEVRHWEEAGAFSKEKWTVLPLRSVSVEKKSKTAPLKADAAGFVNARPKDGGNLHYVLEAPLSDVLRNGKIAGLEGLRGLRLQALPGSAFKTGDGVNGMFELSEVQVTLVRPQMPPHEIRLSAVAATAEKATLEKVVDGNPATTWKNAKNTGEPVNAYFRLDPASFPELKDPATALLRVHIRFGVAGGMARFAVCTTADEGPWTPTMLPDPVRAQLAIAPQERSPEVVQQIRTFYADSVDAEGLRLSRELRSLEESKPALEPLMAAVLEVAKRETRIHLRGDFLQKGDSVSPGVFGFLPALQPRGEHPDRLDLAHWLMDPANPLTARVTVNHFWKQLFGRGLVSTENDFGTRGERPSHPELLDWLALEFQRLGWSRKALLKTILLSHTYRQSSQDRSDVREVDPLNILLARQNRLRLEAEVVRDVSLAASGLLNPKIGGPSIKPPLPPDLAALNYAGGLRWEASKGAEVYRRGLYIHFQRTVPYPMLMTFDAPESSVTCTRRDRSNTPLQALTLLNNALFVEAARALGNALLTDRHSPEERVQLGFLRVVGRPPTAEEITRLRDFLAAQTRFFEQHPDQARALFPGDSSPVPPNKEKAANLPIQSGAVHESAALVTLSRVLLNLDETITRD